MNQIGGVGNNNNNNENIEIEYMDNSNTNSVQNISNEEFNNRTESSSNNSISPIVEINEEEEEEDEFGDDEVDVLESAKNQSKEVVFENKSRVAFENMQNKPSLIIEKLDDNGSLPVDSNENEELIFNFNENEEGKNIFGEPDTVTIQENIALQEAEKVYQDDLVCIKELENQLLATLPVTKQGLLYVQKRIEREVLEIMELKKEGLRKNKNIEKGIQYNLHKPWIIPISLDKHRIYITLQENTEDEKVDTNNQNNENEIIGFTQSKEDERGIEKDNQKEQFKNIKKLEHKANIYENDYSFQNFTQDVENMINPYLLKKNNPSDETTLENSNQEVGYLFNPKHNTQVIRYYDIQNIFWNSHQVLPEFHTYENLLDPNDHIQGIQSLVLTKAETTNIVGFMILPRAGQNLISPKNVFTPSNYDSNSLAKTYENIGNIQSATISPDKQSILLQIPNHQLSNDSHFLIIENCNYSPNINGIHKSVTIIDDNTIAIRNKRKIDMIHAGDGGIVYSLSHLRFDKYEMKKENGEMKIDFRMSSYENGEESKDHIKLYLFENMKVPDQYSYEKIIRSVAPSLDDILEMEHDNLEKCETYEEMEAIFSKYGISITDLHYDQFSVLEKMLETQLKEMEENIQKENQESLPKLVFHQTNQVVMSNPQLFLADIYISSPFIQRYYGKYIHFHQPEDSIFGRFDWVLSQIDHGSLYITYVLYENMDYFYEKHSKQYIQSILSLTSKNREELDKILKKEMETKRANQVCKLYHYQALVIPENAKVSNYDDTSLKVEQDGKVIYYLPNLSVFYTEDKLFQVINGKKEDLQGKKDGVMALVDDKIYIWSDKDKWVKSDLLPKYNQIRYLCEFGETNIQEIDLDSFDCVYRDKTGCDTRIIGRLRDKIANMDGVTIEFQELEEYVEKKKYKKSLEDMMEVILFKYFSRDIKSIENEMKVNQKEINREEKKKEENEAKKNETNEKEKKNEIIELQDSQDLENLLFSINHIPNDDLKKDFIFQLIDKDGLLIGKDVYSKKFKQKIKGICGHSMYDFRISRSTNILRRQMLLEEQLTVFGDGGDADHDMITCNHCGKSLQYTDFDIVEGYHSSGAHIVSRDVLETDDEEKKGKIEMNQVFDCHGSDFRKILLEKGFTLDSSGKVLTVCDFVLSSLCQKTGVTITTNELIDIIRDSIQLIQKILPEALYIQARKSYFEKTKGFKEKQIQLMEEKGLFKQSYQEYMKIKWRAIVASRFLITIQTSIPSYTRSAKESICVFSSFDGKEGISYLACIFKELQFVRFTGDELVQSEEKAFEDAIEMAYRDFMKFVSIQDLFKKKIEYDRELKKKKVVYLDGDEPKILKRHIYDEVPSISPNFKDLLNKSKTKEEVDVLLNQLMQRMFYVGQQIKLRIQEFIEKDPYLEKSSSFLEKYCCLVDLEVYMDYYYYIQKSSESVPTIEDYMNEAKELSQYLHLYFLESSSMSRCYLRNEDPYPFVFNPIIVGDEDTITQSIIQDKFKIYVDEGKYKGTMREYVGEGNKARDVKTGKTKEQILSKQYTKDEFKNLMNEIQKLNTHIPEKVDNEEKVRKEMRYEDLKKEAENSLRQEISRFVQNIATVLNKVSDSDFQMKCIRLLENLGIFDTFVPNPEKGESNPQKIRQQLRKEANRLHYIKRVYNLYFRTYLSMIQNNYTIEDKIVELEYTTEKVSKEVQEEIYKEYNLIQKFMMPDVRSSFQDLVFDQSSYEIDSIYGKNPIYNHTYTDIIQPSNFDNNQASQVILLLLVQQLNRFLVCVKDMTPQGGDEMRAREITSRKCKNIVDFYLVIFSIMERDKEFYDTCTKEVENYKNQMVQEILENRLKMIRDEDAGLDNYFLKVYSMSQMKTKTGLKIKETEEENEKEQEVLDEDMSAEDRRDMLREKVTQEYMKKGKTLTEAEREELVEQLENDMLEDEMIEMEENRLGEVVDEEAMEASDEILGDGNYGDNVGEHDDL